MNGEGYVAIFVGMFVCLSATLRKKRDEMIFRKFSLQIGHDTRYNLEYFEHILDRQLGEYVFYIIGRIRVYQTR